MNKTKTTLRQALDKEECDIQTFVHNLVLGYMAASAYTDAQFMALNDEAKNTILHRLQSIDEINAYNHFFCL